jgi:hypothetical protein
MRSVRFALSLLLPVVLASCGDPSAPDTPTAHPSFITDGVPTGTSFGNIGALLFDFDGNGTIDGFEVQCTGSLISPTVFLTAAHCIAFLPPNPQLYVSFDESLLPGPPTVIAAAASHFDPAFLPIHADNHSDLHDLGVVILPTGSTSGITPLQLPPAGFLDGLAAQGGLRGQFFINVGYGVDASQTGRPGYGFDGVRKTSKSLFQALLGPWLDLLMNTNATGEGGFCFGDSGSPHLLEGNTQMALATSTGVEGPTCRSSGHNYRLDTPSARAFLGQYVQLP